MDTLPEVKPIYWSELEWLLHHGPNPVNLPVDMDALQAAISMHTMSYLLQGQQSAQVVRDTLEKEIVTIVQNMSRRHDEAMKKETSKS